MSEPATPTVPGLTLPVHEAVLGFAATFALFLGLFALGVLQPTPAGAVTQAAVNAAVNVFLIGVLFHRE